MTTQYKYSIGIKVPAAMIERSNHLACYLGETAGDINTFQSPTHRQIDNHANEFAFKQTMVTINFLGGVSGTLPAMPAHAEGVDTVLAQEALNSLNQAGGITMVVALGDTDEEGGVIPSDESTALGIPVEMLVSKNAGVNEMLEKMNIESIPIEYPI